MVYANLPARIDGRCFCQQVLDAVPCRGGALCQLGATSRRGWQSMRTQCQKMALATRCWMARHWPRRSIGCHHRGLSGEINLAAEALVSTLASTAGQGWRALFHRLRFSRREYYLAERRGGTLRPATISSGCTWTVDPLPACRMSNTAHVDFCVLTEAVGRCQRQCRLLCDAGAVSAAGGLLETVQATFASDAAHANALNVMQKLISPPKCMNCLVLV